MEDNLKTSKEWYALHREDKGNVIIMDPDGWDRTNYEFSFNEELITQEEFSMRLGRSTVLFQKSPIIKKDETKKEK